MSSLEDITSLSREELLALVSDLQCQVMLLQQQVAGLTDNNQELRGEVDRLTRQGKRQAAPFSKGTGPGAYALAAFTSIIQTLLKGGTPPSVIEALADLFRAPRSQTVPP